MRLYELFDLDVSPDGEGVIERLRSRMIDILTPMAANGVPYININRIMDKLRETGSGVAIDRTLVMTVLDPEEVKLVDKIEGDRIYMSLPSPDETKKRESDEEKDKEKISKTAAKQAKEDIKSSTPKATATPAKPSAAPAPAPTGKPTQAAPKPGGPLAGI